MGDLTPANTAELKRLAEAATPGPWRHWGGSYSTCIDRWTGDLRDQKIVVYSDTHENHPHFPEHSAKQFPARGVARWEDAAFIAAANPETVLSLIADNERQAEEIAGLREGTEDLSARLEYVRSSRDSAHDRAQALYTALAQALEQVETYPLDDSTTCMCGSPVAGHNIGSGHAPVSQADHAISLIVEGINKALGWAALPLGTVEGDDLETADPAFPPAEEVEKTLRNVACVAAGLGRHADVENIVSLAMRGLGLSVATSTCGISEGNEPISLSHSKTKEGT